MPYQSIRTWQERYVRGEFDAQSTPVQVEAGWYDWFCRDALLAGKTQKHAMFVLALRNSIRLNILTMGVSFKNCSPLGAPTYDRLSLVRESGEPVWVIEWGAPNQKACTLYGANSGFKEPLVDGSEIEVLRYLLADAEVVARAV